MTWNLDDINVDDEFDALSTGMDEEDDDDDGAGAITEDDLAAIKQLEDEIDEEENPKEEGLHKNADAWKADYSNQPEQVTVSQPQNPPPQQPPQNQPQPLPQQVQQQPPKSQAQAQPKPQQQQIQNQQKPQVQPQKAQNQSQKQQEKPKAQPQKQQEQPKAQPQKQQEPPKTQPQKPKKAQPADFINEKANSESYNQLFETFADTFYSLLHSKSNQQEYLEQIEKILPTVVNGPSQPIEHMPDLSKPKHKAPSYRSYDEFKKKSISTASDQKEIEKVIKEIEEQIETLKKDAKLLLSLKCKNFAAYIIRQMKVLKLSIIRMREEPYYISDVFHYYIPDVDANVPLNSLRVKITTGSGFPKNDIIIAILLPMKEQGFLRINTSCVKGPNPNFNYQVDVPLTGLRDPNAFKRFQTEPSIIGVYLNVGKEIPKEAEPKAISTIRTGFLFRHHTLSCPSITFGELPGALLNVECSTHHALSQPEMKPAEIRIKVSPFVLFAKKSKKAAAEEASQKGAINTAAKQTEKAKKQELANSAAHKVQPKAEMRSQEEIIKKQQTPLVYVFTDEELNMFWSGQVVMFVVDACQKVAAISQKKGEPIQKGVVQMTIALSKNWKKIEEKIENEEISQEQYMDMIKKAIQREQARLPSIPQKDRQTHEGYITLMKEELEQCKQQMEE